MQRIAVVAYRKAEDTDFSIIGTLVSWGVGDDADWEDRGSNCRMMLLCLKLYAVTTVGSSPTFSTIARNGERKSYRPQAEPSGLSNNSASVGRSPAACCSFVARLAGIGTGDTIDSLGALALERRRHHDARLAAVLQVADRQPGHASPACPVTAMVSINRPSATFSLVGQRDDAANLSGQHDVPRSCGIRQLLETDLEGSSVGDAGISRGGQFQRGPQHADDPIDGASGAALQQTVAPRAQVAR